MNIELLGDEQKTYGFPVISPTDLDTAAKRITKNLKDRYSFDFVNPELWSLIGATMGPVYDFLNSYMKVARKLKSTYNAKDKSEWIRYLHSEKGTDAWKLEIYLDAFDEETKRGAIPLSILKPWTYTPPEKTSIFSKLMPKNLGWWALGAVGVYAAVKEIF